MIASAPRECNLADAAADPGARSFAPTMAWLFLLAVAVCVAAGAAHFYRTGVAGLDADEQEYWNLSSGILSGHFSDPGRRTLGFPLILAVLRLALPSFALVQAAVTLLAATAPPLLACALYRASGNRCAAILAGAGLALWPPQIFLATSLYSETVALPVFLAALTQLPGRSGWRQWFVLGALLGVLAHIRTMYQLFLPPLFLIILLDCRDPRKAARGIGGVLAGFLLVVLPWSFYVSHQLGSPTLLTANGGETIAGGLNPNLLAAKGSVSSERRTTWVGPGKWIPADHTGYLDHRELGLPYGQQNKLLTARTIEWIKANPQPALYLTWRKVLYMWGLYPMFSNGLVTFLFGNVPILALMTLFVWSLAADPEVRKRGARFYLVPVFVTGVAVISWGSWRFRQPADAAMIAIAAWALVRAMGPRFGAATWWRGGPDAEPLSSSLPG